MVRALLAAVTGATTLVAGVVHATPAFARGKSVDRNITCEAPPPSADTVTSRQRSVGLQLPAFGINGDRARVASRTDVVIATEGSAGWLDMTMYLQACRAITLTWPNNPTKQIDELFKVREKLRRASTDTPAPGSNLTISDGKAAAIFAASREEEGATPPQPRTAPTPPAKAQQQHRQPAQTVPQRVGYGAPGVNYAAPAAGSDMMSADFRGVTTRTCTTSAPITMPGVGIRVGNIILSGMPVTISNGETTCSTTTSP